MLSSRRGTDRRYRMEVGRGPGEIFARHRYVYLLSLLGAFGSGVLFARRSAQASGSRRAIWAVLALGQMVQAVGIVRARARATAGLGIL